MSSHKHAYLGENALDCIDTHCYNGLDKAQKTPKIMSDSQQERLWRRGEPEGISELLRRFIEHLRSHGRSEQTTRSYSSDLKLFARWFYETNREELTPKSITPIDLREYKRYLLEDRGLKPATEVNP